MAAQDAAMVADSAAPDKRADEGNLPVGADTSAPDTRAAEETGPVGAGSSSNRAQGRGGSRARFHHQDRTEFDSLPETKDPKEILHQMEFYFSDNNLKTDKHMFLKIMGPKNDPVSVKHLLTFKRSRRFTDYSAVVDALRGSKILEVVTTGDFAGEGNEGVRRKTPITIHQLSDDDINPANIVSIFDRQLKIARNEFELQVYVKGFDKEDKMAGQLALEEFFKPYGAVSVRRRRVHGENANKVKDSAFVIFGEKEDFQKFMALDPKPTFDGQDLLILSKKDYVKKKCDEKGLTYPWIRYADGFSPRGRGARRNNNRGNRGGNHRGGNHRGGNRSGERHDNTDWNKRREDFQADEAARKRKAETTTDGDEAAKRTKTSGFAHDE